MSVRKKSFGKSAKPARAAAKKPAVEPVAESVPSLRAGAMRKIHLTSEKLFEPPDPC
jgi:hypothetical protein